MFRYEQLLVMTDAGPVLFAFRYYPGNNFSPQIIIDEGWFVDQADVRHLPGGSDKPKAEQHPLPPAMLRGYGKCERIVDALIDYASDHPDWNDADAAQELARDRAHEDAYDALQAAE